MNRFKKIISPLLICIGVVVIISFLLCLGVGFEAFGLLLETHPYQVIAVLFGLYIAVMCIKFFISRVKIDRAMRSGICELDSKKHYRVERPNMNSDEYILVPVELEVDVRNGIKRFDNMKHIVVSEKHLVSMLYGKEYEICEDGFLYSPAVN